MSAGIFSRSIVVDVLPPEPQGDNVVWDYADLAAANASSDPREVGHHVLALDTGILWFQTDIEVDNQVGDLLIPLYPIGQMNGAQGIGPVACSYGEPPGSPINVVHPGGPVVLACHQEVAFLQRQADVQGPERPSDGAAAA